MVESDFTQKKNLFVYYYQAQIEDNEQTASNDRSFSDSVMEILIVPDNDSHHHQGHQAFDLHPQSQLTWAY